MFPAALAALLSLLLFCSNTVVASPFVVTSYIEEVVSTADDYTYDGLYTTSVQKGRTYTVHNNVKPTAASVQTLSVETTINPYYSDVTVVQVLVPTGVATTLPYGYDDYGDYGYETSSYDGYLINLSYSAPTTCTNTWVYTTATNAYVPPLITPTPTSISTSYYQYEAFGETSTYLYAFIDPSILPSSSLSSLSYYAQPSFVSYSYCNVPSAYQTGLVTPGTGGDGSDDGSDYPISNSGSGSSRYDCYDSYSYYRCDSFPPLLAIVLGIIFGWLGLFLIIGLIESYITFSRLARGRRARRGLPIAFAFLFPFLSCFFLCCHQRGFQAKTPAEQETMTADWKAMGFFKKTGKWLKWGFRYKYPDFLGTAPLRRKKWQDKEDPAATAAAAAAAGAPQMTGPLPPPGSMYVVGNPADVAQRGSVYPPPPGAPPGGWYAPQPVDASGNPIPVPYQYGYAPQGYAPPPGATGATGVPGPSVSGGVPASLQAGVSPQGSPPQGAPSVPQQAHLGVAEESRGVEGSPVSPASEVVGGSGGNGGSPMMAGGVPVVAGREVVGGEGVVHEAPAGEVREVEGKGKAPA